MAETTDRSVWDRYRIDDTRAVTLECIKTSRALAELKGIIGASKIPKVIPEYIRLCEARSSYGIDGIIAYPDEILKSPVAREGDFGTNVKKVLGYSQVLKECSSSAPTADLLMRIRSGIGDGKSGMRKEGENSSVSNGQEVVYTAPQGRLVAGMVEEMMDFVNGGYSTDELITVAMAHLMFESIRPFDKGNGCTGRAFMHVLLNHYGLTDGCGIMISPSLRSHRNEYFNQLQNAETTGRTEDWILFMMKVMREGSLKTMEKIHAVRVVYDEIKERLEDLPYCSDELVDVLFTHAFTTNRELINSGIAGRVTSMKYLRSLEDAGILKSEKVGREVVYKNVLLYNSLVKEL